MTPGQVYSVQIQPFGHECCKVTNGRLHLYTFHLRHTRTVRGDPVLDEIVPAMAARCLCPMLMFGLSYAGGTCGNLWKAIEAGNLYKIVLSCN